MELNLKIESGIPIPTATARRGNNIELLRSMKPGDSVYFDHPIVKRATRFYRVAKRIGAKVVIRKEDEGMRLWLVSWDKEPSSASSKPERKPAKKAVAGKPTMATTLAAKKKAAKKAPKKAAKKAVAPGKPGVKPVVTKRKPPKTTTAPKRSHKRKVTPATMGDLATLVPTPVAEQPQA